MLSAASLLVCVSLQVAIGVNQAYVGSSGMLLSQSNVNVTFHNCSWLPNPVCEHPTWQVSILAICVKGFCGQDVTISHK